MDIIEKFFVLDDEEIILDLLKKFITKYFKIPENNTYCSQNPINALTIIERLNYNSWPDIFIVDLLMLEMDGINFYQKIKEKYPENYKNSLKYLITGITLENHIIDTEERIKGMDITLMFKPVRYIDLFSEIKENLRLMAERKNQYRNSN